MLKKKVLTAVLTAAFVLGIGGMVPETFSVHEHEIGIAHAAAEKVAHWRCYWCGKTATSKASHSGMGATADPPSSSSNGKCVSGHSHGWVFVEGAPPSPSRYVILHCRQCGKTYEKINTAGGGSSAPQKGCSGNKGSYHYWINTGIVKR